MPFKVEKVSMRASLALRNPPCAAGQLHANFYEPVVRAACPDRANTPIVIALNITDHVKLAGRRKSNCDVDGHVCRYPKT